MNMTKTKFLLSILTATIILLMPVLTIAADPPAPVAKTGQTACYNTSGTEVSCAGTGQDGEYQYGVASSSPRFTDNGDGTVTDNLTGLMWAKNANLAGAMTWFEAIDFANNLSLGGEGCVYKENCGGSSCGQPDCDPNCKEDWRLPNRSEMESLLDFSNYNPALPSGHPFTRVTSYIWSSTSYASATQLVWLGHPNGYWVTYNKAQTHLVLPVRSAN